MGGRGWDPTKLGLEMDFLLHCHCPTLEELLNSSGPQSAHLEDGEKTEKMPKIFYPMVNGYSGEVQRLCTPLLLKGKCHKYSLKESVRWAHPSSGTRRLKYGPDVTPDPASPPEASASSPGPPTVHAPLVQRCLRRQALIHSPQHHLELAPLAGGCQGDLLGLQFEPRQLLCGRRGCEARGRCGGGSGAVRGPQWWGTGPGQRVGSTRDIQGVGAGTPTDSAAEGDPVHKENGTKAGGVWDARHSPSSCPLRPTRADHHGAWTCREVAASFPRAALPGG